MKKLRLLTAVALAGMLLTACKGDGKAAAFDPQESCVYVTGNGDIFSALVYASGQDNDAYDEDELRAYVEEAVAEYNTLQGAAAETKNSSDGEKLPVALSACELEGNTGTLIFEYADGASLSGFSAENGDDSHSIEHLEVTTVGNGLVQGAVADKKFFTPRGGEVPHEEVSRQTDAGLVIVDGAALVQTDKQIRYVTEGAELMDDYRVRLPEGTNYIVFQ